MSKVLYFLGFASAVDGVYVIGKQIGVIPQKEKIEEMIQRKETSINFEPMKKQLEMQPVKSDTATVVVESKQSFLSELLWGSNNETSSVSIKDVPVQNVSQDEKSSLWSELLWGSNSSKSIKVSQTVSPESLTSPIVVDTPHSNTILTTSVNKISAFFDTAQTTVLEALLPYWEFVEIIIAFHMTLVILTFVFFDIYLILKVMSLFKKIIIEIKFIFSSSKPK